MKNTHASLSLLILLLFHCSTSSSKEMEAEVMTDTNYRYFRWHNSIRDGYVVVETKIYQNPNECHGDYNCSPQDHIKKNENLRPSDSSLAIPLKWGSDRRILVPSRNCFVIQKSGQIFRNKIEIEFFCVYTSVYTHGTFIKSIY